MPTSSNSFTCNNLFKACKRLLRLLKRPISIRAFRFRNLRRAVDKMSPKRRRRSKFRSVRAVFWPLITTKSEESDQVRELPCLTAEQDPAPFPSPVTPAYMETIVKMRERESGDEEERENDGVETACRSFESYLMEMLMEERKVRDLMDVEELLYCWQRLKSPVFIELVCRFYGELCKDLFNGDDNSVDEAMSEAGAS
ncbi:hypothetical protein LUZ60_003904 [Juncus effusus]|nr:hypothetical protein LUZ60_003904 [Juncus effusus]